ncbi:MAG TPA: helix-turn-helix transcriptional regulator [Streptosporangiaceae bacterium]|nr:helix-turn-helix transcriptional regulator [Streptosporangiaceae bacterium]
MSQPAHTTGRVGTGTAARRWIVTVDGRRLRQLRRQHGLSQEMLADVTGISLTTIGRLERQDRPSCRGRTLARLAAALGQHPADLHADDGCAPGC